MTLSVRSFQVPPRRHLGLTAELAFGADFAGDAADFRGKPVELIHHRIDGVLQLQDFALDVDRNLSGRSPRAIGRGHFGDVADLAGEVGGHRVDVVGEVLPGTGDARHHGLSAELAFGSDFARHAGDFGREGVELIDHRVDGVLELENFALHVDRDLPRQIAAGDGRRHFGNVANLVGEVLAIEFTLSVRSFQVPATPGTAAWPPSLPSVPTSRATRLTSDAKALS